MASDFLQHRSRYSMNTYLDHVFWMRLHLFDKDEGKAADHLRAALQSAEHHHALNRLEVELRLSPEIRWTQFAELLARQAPSMIETTADEKSQNLNDTIIGNGPAISRVRQDIDTYADHDLPILILGETGTGKDLVARSIHQRSDRRNKPFMAINCGAVNDNLLEGELFGHAQGSYTGAVSQRAGLIQASGHGTLFLDEIADTSPRFQVALLRLLENREYRPVGSDTLLPMHCRIIAATNADLAEAVQNGRFRRDLLFRLQSLQLHLPPLRERPEDIPELALYFLNLDEKRARSQLDDRLIYHLQQAPWPGNIRQLRNEMDLLRVHYPLKDRITLSDYQDLPGQHQSGSFPSLPAINQQSTADFSDPSSNFSYHDRTDSDPAFTPIGNPRMVRLEKLRELFRQHRHLTRKRCIEELGVSHATMTSYLKELVAAGFITKVMPNQAPASHYFSIND